MVKIMVLLLCVCLSGCSLFFKKEKEYVYITKTIEVDKPVFQCPSKLKEMNYPTRPSLHIWELTEQDATDPGKVAQYYKASIKQLLNYAEELEQTEQIVEKVCD